MTIIAYHNGVVMADRRIIVQGSNCNADVIIDGPKVFISSNKRGIVGLTGKLKTPEQIDIIEAYLHDVIMHIGMGVSSLKHMDSEHLSKSFFRMIDLENTGYLYVTKEAVFILNGETHGLVPKDKSVFMGSGADYVKAAIACGLNLEKAMLIPQQFDSQCGDVLDRLVVNKVLKTFKPRRITTKIRGRKPK